MRHRRAAQCRQVDAFQRADADRGSAGGEVASRGALVTNEHLAAAGGALQQLTTDLALISGGIGQGSEEQEIWIVDACHAPILSINFYIDNGRYIA